MGNSLDKSVIVPPKQPQISSLTHAGFDPAKISGQKWFEIARLKNDFEEGCFSVAHSITAVLESYQLSSGCYKEDSTRISTKQGQLYFPNPNDPSKMQLVYPGWFGGKAIDFWVYDHSEDKGYLVVGNQEGMGWILSNKVTMSWCDLAAVLEGMEKRGFDLHRDNVRLKWKDISACGCTGK